MNNSTTTSIEMNENFSRIARKNSDTAPMVITRLSGWIDIGEVKTTNPAWIIHTRVTGRTR
jgi:succinyl-CoA synthetase beta subunit